MGYLPWQRPGFDLGLKLGKMAEEHPEYRRRRARRPRPLHLGQDGQGVLSKRRLRIINKAAQWLARTSREARVQGRRSRKLSMLTTRAEAAAAPHAGDPRPHFQGRDARSAISPMRRKCWSSSMPRRLTPWRRSAPPVPIISCAPRSGPRSCLMTPRRTTRCRDLRSRSLESYRKDYAAYYERCKHANSPKMRDPNAGHLSRAAASACCPSPRTRRPRASRPNSMSMPSMSCAALRACPPMSGLPEQEAFNIEYWLLEEAKLQRMPKPKSLAGRVAFVTGGAGGIGQAIARTALERRGLRRPRRHRQGCVAVDGRRFRQGVSARTRCAASCIDVTQEDAVIAAVDDAVLRYRRRRHRRQQCRDILGRPCRGYDPRSVEQEHVDSRRPAIFWWRARAIA